MKKASIIMIVILMLVAALSGCVQQPIVSPSPEKSAELTAMPELSVQPSHEMTPEEQTPEQTVTPGKTQETDDFPIITEDIQTYDDLIALIGEPDKETKGWDAGQKNLFYNKYNRVFMIDSTEGESRLHDMTCDNESFGELTFGLSQNEVKKILGKPTSKSKVDYNEHDGGYMQSWSYNKLSLGISFISDYKSMKDATVWNYWFDEKYLEKSSCGIGIGSTKEEVISAYCIGIYYGDRIYEDVDDNGKPYTTIQFGGGWGAITLRLTDNKVTSIYSGVSH